MYLYIINFSLNFHALNSRPRIKDVENGHNF